MLTVHFNTNAADVVAAMRDEKRRAFAIVNAVNATAKEVQKAEVAHFRSAFHVRPERSEWMLRQVAIIKPWASVGANRLWAKISVGRSERLLLSEFEEGGTHVASRGPNIAIPTTVARPTMSANIVPSLLYKALGLKRRGAQAGQGEQGTYIVPGVGVSQNQGESRRLVYLFKPSSRLPRKLRFAEIGMDIAKRVFPEFLREEVQKTLNFGARQIGLMTEKVFR